MATDRQDWSSLFMSSAFNVAEWGEAKLPNMKQSETCVDGARDRGGHVEGLGCRSHHGSLHGCKMSHIAETLQMWRKETHNATWMDKHVTLFCLSIYSFLTIPYASHGYLDLLVTSHREKFWGTNYFHTVPWIGSSRACLQLKNAWHLLGHRITPADLHPLWIWLDVID